jgi:uncharacterized protein YndB with AHSA1/START domain
VTDGAIILATVDVPSPASRVFQALTTDECELWWGAQGVYTIEDWRADLRVGGAWSLVVLLPDGTTMPASGEFLELEPPSRIVQTRRYDWNHPAIGRRITTVTTQLEETDLGTRVVVRHEGLGDSAAAHEHANGWERLLDWLREYLMSESSDG